MPYSLWLVPHEGNPFTKTVREFISDTVPRNFTLSHELQSFIPHVTVTSDVDVESILEGKSPQEWLDQLQLPEFKAEKDEVWLELDSVEAEDPFHRKMNIALKDNANLTKLATCCRRQANLASDEDAESWARNVYRPHLSLLYADLPTKAVKNKVPLIESKIGFAFGDLFACCGGTLCLGGYLVLVDTSKPVNEWEIVAKRETRWAMWKATRNLI